MKFFPQVAADVALSSNAASSVRPIGPHGPCYLQERVRLTEAEPIQVAYRLEQALGDARRPFPTKILSDTSATE